MPTHKFKIGQLVSLRPSAARNVPGGQYVITKRLPEHDGEFEYQVRSGTQSALILAGLHLTARLSIDAALRQVVRGAFF